MHSSIINEQMRVFICGGGIGGLSSALSLAKGLNVGHKPLITVQESLSEASILLHANKRNLGLWGPALKILRDLEIYTDDMDITFVKNSSYRSFKSGARLAYPRILLDNPDSKTSLGFMKEKELLLRLLDAAHKEDSIQLRYGDEIKDVKQIDPYPDLVIAADGRDSTLRRSIYPDFDDILQTRGYTIFRGFTSYDNYDKPIDAFQTWGPGMRFAVVPAPRGNAWYAAISPNLLSNEMSLADLFVGWHDPVYSLVAQADEEIYSETAVAFNRVVQCGLSTTKDGIPIAFLGDASHTLDPILAQGAGVAIEDASHLAKLLSKMKDPRYMRNVLRAYESGRKDRLNRLHLMSNISQMIGHIETPFLLSLRDLILGFPPSALKSLAFDELIHYTLSGRDKV